MLTHADLLHGCGVTSYCRAHLSNAGLLFEPNNKPRPPFVDTHALFYCPVCDLVIEVKPPRRLVRTFPLAGSVGFRPKLGGQSL